MTYIAGFFAPLTDEGGFKEDYMEGQGTMKMNNRGIIRCSLQVKAQGRQHIEHWRGGEAKPVLRFADPPGFGYAKLGEERKESMEEATERYLCRRHELARDVLHPGSHPLTRQLQQQLLK